MMPERRAVVVGPAEAVLVERRLQSLVAEGWVPMGALGCAATAEGLVIVGVFERALEDEGVALSAAEARAEAPRVPPAPVMRMPQRRERPEPSGREAGPLCPLCEGEMVRRVRKADGAPFWGCAGFPECRGIVNWRDWAPVGGAMSQREAEEAPTGRQALLPNIGPLPGGFAPAGEAAACWGQGEAPAKPGEASVERGTGRWMGDPEDEIPF